MAAKRPVSVGILPSLPPLIASEPAIIATKAELKAAGLRPSYEEGQGEREGRLTPFGEAAQRREGRKFRPFFSDLELTLRTAAWIRKLSLLSERERTELLGRYAEATKKRAFLRRETAHPDFESLIIAWYERYNPQRATPDFLKRIFGQLKGHEAELFNKLYATYVDPDWDISTPLWFEEGE